MKQFKRLGREEMRMVKAGQSGGCGVGKSCIFFLEDGSFNYESGICTVTNLGFCNCVAQNGDWGSSEDCSFV
jgi:hypothetical protein